MLRFRSFQREHRFAQARLSRLIDGDLSRRTRLRLARHVEECPDCSRGVQVLRALVRRSGLLGTQTDPMPEAVLARFRDRAQQEAQMAGEPQ